MIPVGLKGLKMTLTKAVGKVTIKLVDSEVDVAKMIAEKRDQYHRDRGNKTAEYWTDDFLETYLCQSS